MFLKLDLKKAYDKVNWIFLRMLLIHIGLKWEVFKWIIGCISSVNYAILINGSPTYFFKGNNGIIQGCPLSPLLFLLVIEALCRKIRKAHTDGSFKGLKVTKGL